MVKKCLSYQEGHSLLICVLTHLKFKFALIPKGNENETSQQAPSEGSEDQYTGTDANNLLDQGVYDVEEILRVQGSMLINKCCHHYQRQQQNPHY